ncbi:MAG: hypothetical protein K5896_02070 [Prevotella sp.]|nr:hypothetical protein [Prevotella sp.]
MTGTIILIVLISIEIILLASGLHWQKVVKAGDADDFCFGFQITMKSCPEHYIKIEDRDQSENVDSLCCMYVNGNSMKDYDIYDGQQVLVLPYRDEERNSISHFPVIVLNIQNGMWLDSKYKLRKFVGYVDIAALDAKALYATYKNRIRISEERFTERIERKLSKLGETEGRYILSETFKEKIQGYDYSLHPIDTLYAKVVYAN